MIRTNNRKRLNKKIDNILSNIKDINSCQEQDVLEGAIKLQPRLIKIIHNPNDELLTLAIKSTPSILFELNYLSDFQLHKKFLFLALSHDFFVLRQIPKKWNIDYNEVDLWLLNDLKENQQKYKKKLYYYLIHNSSYEQFINSLKPFPLFRKEIDNIYTAMYNVYDVLN